MILICAFVINKVALICSVLFPVCTNKALLYGMQSFSNNMVHHSSEETWHQPVVVFINFKTSTFSLFSGLFICISVYLLMLLLTRLFLEKDTFHVF